MSPRQVPATSSHPVGHQRRRALLAALGASSLLAIAASIGGCPIYAADSCEADPNCTSTQTYPTYDTGVPSECGTCLPGYVCSGSTGRFQCVASDCRAPEKACTGGLACTDIGGVYACRSRSDAGTDGSDGAPPVIDCKTTGCISGLKCVDDGAGGHVCASTDPNACTADTDCPPKTGDGSLCLGGVCKAPKDLCTDSVQCDAGKSCLDGRCVAKCTASSCASGYACDAKSGLCTGGASACPAKPPPAPTGDAGTDASSSDSSTDETSSGDAGTDTAPSSDSATSDGSSDGFVPARVCSSTAACVATHCVDKCATDGSCKAGLVCVGGGCVPDDRPLFFCDKDGTKDGTQDLCAAGSVCLHHNCYVACAGPGDTSCAKFDKFPVCKTVTTSSGDHSVCGSATSLGSECDLTTSPPKTCSAGKVCLDGYCK